MKLVLLVLPAALLLVLIVASQRPADGRPGALAAGNSVQLTGLAADAPPAPVASFAVREDLAKAATLERREPAVQACDEHSSATADTLSDVTQAAAEVWAKSLAEQQIGIVHSGLLVTSFDVELAQPGWSYLGLADEADGAIDASDGPYRRYHENGQLAESGEVRSGRKVGRWMSWHENGERATRGDYVHGMRHGIRETWHADGARKSRGDFVYGKRDGAWSKWHPNGHTAESGSFVHGEREGAWRSYHADGTRREESFYVHGQYDGVALSYHSGGSQLAERAAYVFGSYEGPYRAWHPNGQLSQEGTFENGERVGRWASWNDAGEREPGNEGFYVAGERIGD